MKRVETLVIALILAVLAVFPLLFPNPAVTSIAFFSVAFAAAAVGWNMFCGYTGYVSLGYAVFYGVGAYSFAFLSSGLHITGDYVTFLLLIPAGLIACLFALPVGWLVLRTRRHVFIVLTIATVFIMQLLAYNLDSITGGSKGLILSSPSWSGDFFNIPFYYVALILLLLALVISWWIRHSKYGLGLLAIREDEDRARSLGVNTEAFKLSALVISAFFSATAGALMSYYNSSVDPPSAFSPVFDVVIALMNFIGGVGTLLGPLLGAFILEPLQQYITLQFGAIGLDLILFGALLLAVILLLPEGVVTSLGHLWAKRRAARTSIVELAPAPEEQAALVAGEKRE